MKFLSAFALLFLLISCRKTDYDVLPPVSTSISGRAFDPTTNAPLANFKLILKREWKQNCGWLSSCWKEEKIAEISTDSEGYYNYTFGYIPANDRSKYQYILFPKDEMYRFDDFEGLQPIEPGKENIRDFNVWKPVVLNVNMKVSNNNLPPLYIEVFRQTTNYYSYGSWNFPDKNGEKTYDFKVRPNTDVKISFIYYENYNTANSKMHKIDFPYKTKNVEETISYTIDCSTF